MRRLLILALALVAALGIVSSASAKGRDANHDRLPDRWERAHHLSLKVKQARRDQDRDGLNNRGEFRAGTNPRDRDSDDDGIEDGNENAGTVKSFEGGVLTIALAQGGELSATVDGDTEIECHGTAAMSSHDGGDDNSGPSDSSGSGPGSGSDDGPNHDAGDDNGDDGPNHDVNDDNGDDGPNHEAGEDDGAPCGTGALTAGAKVLEAELQTTASGKRWEKVELSA